MDSDTSKTFSPHRSKATRVTSRPAQQVQVLGRSESWLCELVCSRPTHSYVGTSLTSVVFSPTAEPQENTSNRLNTHLSTLVMADTRSTAFRTPVESGGRTTGLKTQPRATSLSLGCLTCRISSFGFSGTIAHGLFSLSAQTKKSQMIDHLGNFSFFRICSPTRRN